MRPVKGREILVVDALVVDEAHRMMQRRGRVMRHVKGREIIVDEAHHMLPKPGAGSVVKQWMAFAKLHNAPVIIIRHVGTTGTPERTDKRPLAVTLDVTPGFPPPAKKR